MAVACGWSAVGVEFYSKNGGRARWEYGRSTIKVISFRSDRSVTGRSAVKLITEPVGVKKRVKTNNI